MIKNNHHTPLSTRLFSTLPFWALNVKHYLNVLEQRTEISKDMKNKTGIYCWYNNINGNFYIGSATDLRNRINDYFQPSYYKDKKNLIIIRAILKYGIGNFSLIILEYTTVENLLEREQHWLDKLNPEYNTLERAGNSQGYKQTPENILDISKKALGRKHSELVRLRMSQDRKGANNSFFGKDHSLETKEKLRLIALNREKSHKPGICVKVTDILNSHVTEYTSIREAAKALDTNISTLISREKRKSIKPFRNRYKIDILRK